jgi:hypothetical protein
MQDHHHGRVKEVANTVLRSLEQAIEASYDVTRTALPAFSPDPQGETIHLPDEQPEKLAELQSDPAGRVRIPDSASGADDVNPADGEEHRVQNLNSVSDIRAQYEEKQTDDIQVQNLNSDSEEHRVQNLNSVSENREEYQEKQSDSIRVQILNSVPVCSSSFFNKTTTTKTKTPRSLNSAAIHRTDATDLELHFPTQLRVDERALARVYLGRIPTDRRQDVLDELQGRLGDGATGGPPIRNPIGYLVGLCNAADTDTFQLTSFGLQVRLARERTAERAQAEAAKDTHHRRELSAHPVPKGPLVDKLLAIRQQVQDHRHGATPATPTGLESMR